MLSPALRHPHRRSWCAAAGSAAWQRRSITEGSQEEVLSYFTGIVPRARQLLSLPKSWRRWATADREPIAQWTFGRATLLGDAAHPMLQYLAQGAAHGGIFVDDRQALRKIRIRFAVEE